MCLIIIELSNYVTIEKEDSLLQINENLSKKLQELEARLTDTNNELKKTKEALEVAKNTIAQCKEENVNLEDRLSKCHKEHILQVDAISSRQKDVIITFFNLFFINLIYYIIHLFCRLRRRTKKLSK